MSGIDSPFFHKYNLTDEDVANFKGLFQLEKGSELDFEVLRKKVNAIISNPSALSEISDNIHAIIADILVLNCEFDLLVEAFDNLRSHTVVYYLAYSAYKMGNMKFVNMLSNLAEKKIKNGSMFHEYISLIKSLINLDYNEASNVADTICLKLFPYICDSADIPNSSELLIFPTQNMLILEVLAELFIQQLKFDTAKKIITLLEKIAEIQVNPYTSLISQIIKAQVEFIQGHFMEALQTIEEAIMIEKLINNDSIKAYLLYTKAKIHTYFEELDVAANLLEKIIDSNALKYQKQQAKLMLMRIACKRKINEQNPAYSLSPDAQKWIVENSNRQIDYFLTKLMCLSNFEDMDKAAEFVSQLHEIVSTNRCSLLQKLEIFQILIEYFNNINEYERSLRLLQEIKSVLDNNQLFVFKLDLLIEGIKTYLAVYFKSQELDNYALLMTHLTELQDMTAKNELPHIEIVVRYIKARVLWSFNRRNEAIEELEISRKLAKTFRYTELIDEIEKTIAEINSNITINTQQHYNSLHNVIQQYGRVKLAKQGEKRLPEAYIILDKETGVPVFEYSFDEKNETKDKPILLSGLVAAVLMYSSSVIGSSDIQQFNYGEYKIFIEHLNNFVHLLISKDKETDFAENLKAISYSLNNEIKDNANPLNFNVMNPKLEKLIKDKFEI